jgi:alpha-L-arabinofuranosidase
MKSSIPHKFISILWGALTGIILGSFLCGAILLIFYVNKNGISSVFSKNSVSEKNSNNLSPASKTIVDLTSANVGGRLTWEGGAKLIGIERETLPAVPGAKVYFPAAKSSGFSFLLLDNGLADWRNFNALGFLVSNPGNSDTSFSLIIKSEKDYKLKKYTDTIVIPAAKTISVMIPLYDISSQTDLDKIGLMSLLSNSPLEKTLIISPIFLVKKYDALKRSIVEISKPPQSSKNVAMQKDALPILKFSVNPQNVLRQINPMIYGSNLPAKTEFEKDVASFAKDTGITIFRYPGGALEGYRWKSGVFELNERYKDAPLAKIDNVVQFAQLTNSKLLLEVNIKSASPEEAAQWVNYMNKQTNFRVDYWELGNEVYGDWDEAYMSGEEYAEIVKEFSTAMKAVDPAIKIGVNVGGTNYPDFDSAVIRLAADYFDFLSFHWYPNHVNKDHPHNNSIHPSAEDIMANAHEVSRIMERFNRLLEKHAPHRKNKIEIGFLEWDGSWDGASSDLKYEARGMIWSLANAIFHADVLGQFANHGVALSCQYTFQEIMFGMIRGWDKNAGWGGDRWDGKTIRPKTLAFKLFAKYFGDQLIESHLGGVPEYEKKADLWGDSYVGGVPYVTAYASKFSAENKIAVVFVNKHPDQAFNLMLNFANSEPSSTGKAWLLHGPALNAQNDGNPESVKIKEFNVNGINKEFYVQLPAKSVLLMQIPIK